jgi:FtsH-binding integral membrane protein
MGIDDRDYYKEGARVREIAPSNFASQVYGWLTSGLGITAIVAYLVFRTGAYITLLPYWWVWTLALLGISMLINARAQSISFIGLASLFMGYAAVEGVFFGSILPVFAQSMGGETIWMTFGTAAMLFGLATFYGTMTKSDLTSMGQILSLGVVGLFFVTLLFAVFSFFFQVTWAQLLISYVGLGIFLGLTMTDANAIRQMSRTVVMQGEDSYKMSLMMSFKMYINLIMIFWYLLQILSANNRR